MGPSTQTSRSCFWPTPPFLGQQKRSYLPASSYGYAHRTTPRRPPPTFDKALIPPTPASNAPPTTKHRYCPSHSRLKCSPHINQTPLLSLPLPPQMLPPRQTSLAPTILRSRLFILLPLPHEFYLFKIAAHHDALQHLLVLFGHEP